MDAPGKLPLALDYESKRLRTDLKASLVFRRMWALLLATSVLPLLLGGAMTITRIINGVTGGESCMNVLLILSTLPFLVVAPTTYRWGAYGGRRRYVVRLIVTVVVAVALPLGLSMRS